MSYHPIPAMLAGRWSRGRGWVSDPPTSVKNTHWVSTGKRPKSGEAPALSSTGGLWEHTQKVRRQEGGKKTGFSSWKPLVVYHQRFVASEIRGGLGTAHSCWGRTNQS